MRMIEIDYDAQPPVDGYGPGGFRVAGDWIDGNIVLLADGARALDGDLDTDSLKPVLEQADALDIVLFGMGADIAALPRPVREAVEAAGLGFEIMSTASACRTYNVLLTEDRRVAAVLQAV